MKNKDLKKEFIFWLDSILEIMPMVNRIVGRNYFKSEYMVLEHLRDKVNNVEIEEKELKNLKKMAIGVLLDLKFFMINRKKFSALLN